MKIAPAQAVDDQSVILAQALLTDRAGYLVRRAHQVSAALFSQHRARADLTPGQFETLAMIDASPRSDQITLARLLGIDRSTTTVIIDGLARRGLLERKVETDRRRRLLDLTEEASDVLRAAQKRARATEQTMIAPLGPAVAEELRGMLKVIAADTTTPAPLWTQAFEGAAAACRPVGTEVDWLFNRFAFLTRRCSQIWNACFMEATAGFDITPGQYAALYMVNAAGVADQTTLVQGIGVDRTTAALLLRLLESRGLTHSSVPAQDRRRRIFQATPAGRELLVELEPHDAKADRWLLSRLTDSEACRLRAAMTALLDAHERTVATSKGAWRHANAR